MTLTLRTTFTFFFLLTTRRHIRAFESSHQPRFSPYTKLFVTVPQTEWETPEIETSPVTHRYQDQTTRQQLKDLSAAESRKLGFLADDHDAAEKISNLLAKLKGGDQQLRNILKNPFKGAISSTTRGVDTPYTSLATTASTRGISRVYEAFTEKSTTSSETHGRDIDTDAATSRHNPSGYRPYHYNSGRKPYRAPPPLGSGDPFSNGYGSQDIRPVANSFSNNMTRVLHIEAECQDEFMRIQVQFNGSFTGLIYSSGYAYDSDCIYVNGSGRSSYDFYIQLNRCGTLGGNEDRRDNNEIRGKKATKNMMWNTLTVQYNPLIEEEWDEHFKVTCEYGYDFWKTVTFPFLDVEVQTGNPVVFTLTPPECHMEIRFGYGPEGRRISGPVRVGDPLTLVIYMRSESDGFDIVVSDCYAHNGGKKKINLIDHYGCPVDEKLISHFDGATSNNGMFETKVFAFMKTFRFTGSPALYIECDVRMCHGDCPTQPCHWRRQGKKVKRSVSPGLELSSKGGIAGPAAETPESVNGNVSEKFKMFQSIQVMKEDDLSIVSQAELSDDDICVALGTFYAMSGMIAMITAILMSISCVMCIRVKKLKKSADCSSRPSLYIPTTYKSDYVPQSKRRLE